jgi:hypothetical protein
MLRKNMNCSLACLAGISAAVVAVLGVGGYLLHKKVMKRRLRELARRQAMKLAMYDWSNGVNYDDYDDCEDEYSDDDYESLYGKFADDGILFHVKGEEQEDDDV